MASTTTPPPSLPVFSITVMKNKNFIVKNKLMRITPDLQTFRDVLNRFAGEIIPWHRATVTLPTQVGRDSQSQTEYRVFLDDDLALATEFNPNFGGN